jgi:hypothetical protein
MPRCAVLCFAVPVCCHQANALAGAESASRVLQLAMQALLSRLHCPPPLLIMLTRCAVVALLCCQVVQRVMLALFKTYEGTILASSHPSQLRTVLGTRAARLYDGDALMQVSTRGDGRGFLGVGILGVVGVGGNCMMMTHSRRSARGVGGVWLVWAVGVGILGVVGVGGNCTMPTLQAPAAPSLSADACMVGLFPCKSGCRGRLCVFSPRVSPSRVSPSQNQC